MSDMVESTEMFASSVTKMFGKFLATFLLLSAVYIGANPTTPGTSKAAKPRFEIKKFNAVATWSYNVTHDKCAICKNLINEECNECQSNSVFDPNECPRAMGVCNHGYHLHCISKWLKTYETCPLDCKPWEFSSYN